MTMNFRRSQREEPEINLIPFIDVLLVILIFLMLSTTYSKFTELQITLPVADAEKARDRAREIIVAVAADGRFAVKRHPRPCGDHFGRRASAAPSGAQRDGRGAPRAFGQVDLCHANGHQRRRPLNCLDQR